MNPSRQSRTANTLERLPIRIREGISRWGLKRERAEYFTDTNALVLYLVFGRDGSWEAIEWDGTTAMSTGPYQPGNKPMSLAACMALTYNETYTL